MAGLLEEHVLLTTRGRVVERIVDEVGGHQAGVGHRVRPVPQADVRLRATAVRRELDVAVTRLLGVVDGLGEVGDGPPERRVGRLGRTRITRAARPKRVEDGPAEGLAQELVGEAGEEVSPGRQLVAIELVVLDVFSHPPEPVLRHPAGARDGLPFPVHIIIGDQTDPELRRAAVTSAARHLVGRPGDQECHIVERGGEVRRHTDDQRLDRLLCVQILFQYAARVGGLELTGRQQ